MYNVYGNVIKLPDGRVFEKTVNGLWKDTKTGFHINEIQLNNLLYSNVFYGNPDGGVGKEAFPWGMVTIFGNDNDPYFVNVPQKATFGAKTISIGGRHVLDLRVNGTVIAWGRDTTLSAGLQTSGPYRFVNAGQAYIPNGITLLNLSKIAAGFYHNVVIGAGNTTAAWGLDNYNFDTVEANQNVTGVKDVALGFLHSVYINTSNGVTCFGRNLENQCKGMPNGLTALQVAAGKHFSVARLGNGGVTAWGRNFDGECGVPISLSGVTLIAAGAFHTLALKTDNTIVSWGSNTFGQTDTPAGLTASKIAAGAFHSLAMKGDGTVVAWGRNTEGQCSVPSTLTGVTAIAAGDFHSIALKTDGTVVGWGLNGNGQATPPADLTGVVKISAGGFHNLALKSNNHLVGWGAGTDGTILTDTAPSPWGAATYTDFEDWGQAIVPNVSGVKQVEAGAYHSHALKTDGTIVSWGRYDNGQWNKDNGGITGVTQISSQAYHTLALKTDGTVVSWGRNQNGEGSVPAGLTGVVQVKASYAHSIVLRDNGGVTGWGVQIDGEGNDYNQGQITGLNGVTGIVEISTGLDHTLLRKDTGAVLGFGNNGNGQCRGTAANGSAIITPSTATGQSMRILGITLDNAIQIAAGNLNSLILRNDRSIFFVGDISSSQLPTVSAGRKVYYVANSDYATGIITKPR